MQEKQTIIGTFYQKYSNDQIFEKKSQIWVSRRNIKRGQLTFWGPYLCHFCLKHHNIWHTYQYLCYTIAQNISEVYIEIILQK